METGTLPSEAALNALEDLLGELFSADELRRFIARLDGGEKLLAALEGEVASAETLFHKAVRVLNRRGEIDGAFFVALIEERPKKVVRVHEVVAQFQRPIPVSAARIDVSRSGRDPTLHLRLLKVEERLQELQPRLRLVQFRCVRTPEGGPLLWSDVRSGDERVLRGGETAEECAELVAIWLASMPRYFELVDAVPLPPTPKNPGKVREDWTEFVGLQQEQRHLRVVLGLEPGANDLRAQQGVSAVLKDLPRAVGPAMTLRAFLSYSHDTPAHTQAVLDLANRLRSDGIDAWIDQYIAAPSEGWPRWMQRQVEESRFVVLVCTETFKRRFEGRETPGTGKGATWEGLLANQVLYDSGTMNEKLIPVLLDDASDEHVPLALKPYTHYRLPAGYDDLYRHLTGQPAVVPPPLGTVRARPPVTHGPALAPQPVVSAGLPVTPPTTALQSLADGLKTCSQESWWMRLSRLLDALRADPRIAVHLPAEPAEPGDPDFLWEYRQARRDIAVHARQAYQTIQYFCQDEIPAWVAPDFGPRSHPLYQVQPRSHKTLHRWEGHRTRLNECYVEPLIEWAGQLGRPGPPDQTLHEHASMVLVKGLIEQAEEHIANLKSADRKYVIAQSRTHLAWIDGVFQDLERGGFKEDAEHIQTRIYQYQDASKERQIEDSLRVLRVLEQIALRIT